MHPRQVGAQALQGGDALVQAPAPRPRELGPLRSRRRAVGRGRREGLADLLQREPEALGDPDERHPPEHASPEQPVTAGCPLGAHEPDRFVEAERGGATPLRSAGSPIVISCHLDLDDTNEWGWLDVTHTLTYTDALRWSWSVDPSPEVLRGLFHAVWFVNWTGRLDVRGGVSTPAPHATEDAEDVFRAIVGRDPDAAVARGSWRRRSASDSSTARRWRRSRSCRAAARKTMWTRGRLLASWRSSRLATSSRR
jgi:hypothetical protein